MKKLIYTLAFIFCFFISSQAQYVTIPDANFRAFLQGKYPSAFNGSGQMDTTNSLIMNETNLDARLKTIFNLEGLQYFKSLIQLDCRNNFITGSVPTLTNTLKRMLFGANSITSFTNIPSSLDTFYCEDNQLTSLPTLPTTLKIFDCSMNNIICLPKLPNALLELYIDTTKIKCLPNTPNNAQWGNGTSGVYAVGFGYNYVGTYKVCNSTNNPNNCPIYNPYVNIPDSYFGGYLIGQYPSAIYFDANNKYWLDTTSTSIINETSLFVPGNKYFGGQGVVNFIGLQYFKKLKRLEIFDNPATYIPNFCDSLEYLDISGTDFTTIPKLPAKLKTFRLEGTNLDSIPHLPDGLENFESINGFQIINSPYMVNTKITSIPNLPSSLKYAGFCFPNLASLPALPTNLYSFYLRSNKMMACPTLNDSLIGFTLVNCSNITTLPPLPQKINSFTIDSTPITCLPKLPSGISSINITGYPSLVTCIPNKPLNLTTTLPICNATNNPNNCPTNPLFEGIVYNDNNSNSKLDNGDIKRPRAKISLQTGEYTFTNDTGFYQITADTIGSNTITISNPNFYNAVPQSITHNFSSYADIATDTFALQPTTTKDSLTTNITNLFGRVRSLQQTGFYCYYENVGTTNLNAIMTINFDSSKLSFDSFYHANWYSAMAHYPSSFINTGNSLVIPINNLIPGQRGFYFPAFKAKQNLIIGDSVLTNVVLTGGTAIATDTSKAFVANSFDPNDKQSTPELTPQQVQSGSNYIDYTIRFENTGNDTAFNVVVADTLSNLLRTNLVQMVSSSHLCRTTLINGVVTFEFLNINLPDSHVNKVGCHGFVRFRILPLQSLSLGAIIPNKAHIYFDYNTPVATNTATTIIANKPLPVQLSFYTAQLKKQNSQYVVENVWLTTNEINTQLFNVQRSVNGKNFNTIGTVAAKGLGEYRFIDNKLQAIINTNIYYRLQIVDKDGKITYSTIKWIQIKGDAASSVVSIYPNPTKGKFTIQTGEMKEIIITNVLGKIVKQFKVNSEQLIANLETGVYMVKCIMTNGEIKTEKLVVE